MLFVAQDNSNIWHNSKYCVSESYKMAKRNDVFEYKKAKYYKKTAIQSLPVGYLIKI